MLSKWLLKSNCKGNSDDSNVHFILVGSLFLFARMSFLIKVTRDSRKNVVCAWCAEPNFFH